MIDWILNWLKPEEIEEYTYDEVKLPLKRPNPCCGEGGQFWYKTPVRYNEDKIQIRAGRPKNVGWKTVESENTKFMIRKQL